MFKLRLAEYINRNMLERNMTYKDLRDLSGVPDSSLHSYAQARVNNPNDDNLIRIAAAFGDPPEIIQRMRRESAESSAQENRLIAESDDQERMERYAALIRFSVAQLLEEYRIQSAAQQTEIIQHADERVETERRRFKARADEVLRQCNAEVERNAQHNAELMALKDEMIAAIQQEREKVRTYLKRIIRNLSIALIAVSLVSALALAALGGYAFYAYHAFDRADPTRGIYQATPAPEPTQAPDIELEG